MRSTSTLFTPFVLCVLLNACSNSTPPGAMDASADGSPDVVAVDAVPLADAGRNGEDAQGSDAGPDAPLSCPSSVAFVVDSDRVQIAVGMSGSFHNETASSSAKFTLAVERCDEACEACVVHGPIQNAGGTNSFRCLHDPARTCSTDDDCMDAPSGTPSCRSVWDLRAVPNGDIETCNLSFFESNPDEMDPWGIRGRVNLRSGTIRLTRFNLTTNVRFGSCPTCMGDLRADDNMPEGRCEGGANHLMNCDVSSDSGASFDCPLGSAEPRLADDVFVTLNIPIAPLTNDGVEWSLPSGMCPNPVRNPDNTPGPLVPCFCGLCSNDPSVGCRDDDACEGGTCQFPVAPNACASGECDTETSRCVGEVDKACFPNDVLSVSGSVRQVAGGQFQTVLGGLTCFGSSGSPLVDPSAGFPAPGRFSIGLVMEAL